MKAADADARQALAVRFLFDAEGFTRAIEQARKAMQSLGRSIADAMKPLARHGRDLADAQFIAEGGRFYWTIQTGNDGVTRSVRRRDFTGWQR